MLLSPPDDFGYLDDKTKRRLLAAAYGSLVTHHPNKAAYITPIGDVSYFEARSQLGNMITYSGRPPEVISAPTEWRCAYCAGMRSASAYDCDGCGASRPSSP